MTAVLADAGPLYAIAFESDQYHLQARADMERLAADRMKIMVSISTVVEGYALVLRNADPEFAFIWLNTLHDGTESILPTEEDYVQAAQLIQRYRDRTITLPDGVVAPISQRLRLPVWTYDDHFDMMRVNRWR